MVDKKKLNIAIVSDCIGYVLGGSFVSTLRFAKLLRKEGHKVIFISARYPKTKEIDYIHGIKTYRFFSVPFPSSAGKLRASFISVRKLKKIFINEKIDIVHTTMIAPSVYSSIKAARLLGIPTISHPHYQPENTLLSLPKIFQNRMLKELLYNIIINASKKADVVICPTKFAEHELKSRYARLKTIVISNGVNLKRFKRTNFKPFLTKYGLDPNKKKILCVARLSPEKNIDTLIKAIPFVLERHKNVHFNIVGDGNSMPEFNKLSKELKIEDNITIFGRVSDKDLLMAYNSCDIFVLPSLAELEGMVILEAMACCKPIVVANSNDSASRYFVDGNGFLFKPKSPNNLAEKLVCLLDNENLRRKMGQRSFKISKKYDINESILKLIGLYNTLKKA